MYKWSWIVSGTIARNKSLFHTKSVLLLFWKLKFTSVDDGPLPRVIANRFSGGITWSGIKTKELFKNSFTAENNKIIIEFADNLG